MPIVVEHSGSSPTLDAALALFLAQQQQAQQQSPEQPPPEYAPPGANQILHPAAAAQLQGGQPSYPLPADSQQAAGATHTHAGYPRYAAPPELTLGAAQLHNDSLQYDRLGNQDQLAQFRADQSQQRLLERQQQQSQMQAWSAKEPEPPPQVEKAILDGTHEFGPAKQRSIDDLKSQRSKLLEDPAWSPEQKATGVRQLDSQLNAIYQNPDSIPISRRQPPPKMTPMPDGSQIRWQTVVRAGAPKDEPVAVGMPDGTEVPYDFWKEQQKQKHDLDKIALQGQNKAAEAAAREAAKPPRQSPAQRAAQNIRHADTVAHLSDLKRRIGIAQQDVEAADKEIHTPVKAGDTSAATPEDTAALKESFDKKSKAEQKLHDLEREHDDYLQKAQDSEQQIYENEQGGTQPAADTGMQQSEADAIQNAPPPDVLGLQPGQTFIDPTGTPRMVPTTGHPQ